MPVDVRYSVPFVPSEGITSQILSAIQLANEEHARRASQALAQQKAPAEIEELKARAGFYGAERQRIQLEVDQRRAAGQLFGLPGSTSEAAPAPGIAPAVGGPANAPPVATGSPTGAPAAGGGPWVPTGTPPQLAPILAHMIPQDLTDQEKNVIESGAQAGRIGAMQSGNLAGYLNEIRSSVQAVVENRNRVQLQPEKQPLSDADRSSFIKNVLPSMENLSSAQQMLARGAVADTKSRGELEQLQARLMQQDSQALGRKIEQENRVANARVLVQSELARAGNADITKIWTDELHGFAHTLAQANVGRDSVRAGADGNGLLTSLTPTMVVLGMNSFAGLNRINPAEAQAAGAPGGWAERFNIWADKATKGKLTPELAKEGRQLFDFLTNAKYEQSLQSTRMIVANNGLDPDKTTVLDADGNMVKLSEAPKPKPHAAEFSIVAGGKTYTFADQKSLDNFKAEAGIR